MSPPWTRGDDLADAVSGCDAVVHMAAILPPKSETDPELCEAVNVGGTRNVAEVAVETQPTPSLILVSSVAAMRGEVENHSDSSHSFEGGSVVDSLDSIDSAGNAVYGRSKAGAEAVVRRLVPRWSVLRLAGVMPTRGSYPMEMANDRQLLHFQHCRYQPVSQIFP